MFSGVDFERSYRLDFQPQAIGSRLTERTKHLLTQGVLKPRHYEIEVKYVHPNNVREQLARSDFDPSCFGYSIGVYALYNFFINRTGRIPHLLLNILVDQTARSVQLLSLDSWIKIGPKSFNCEYHETQQYGTATLRLITELKHYTSSLYTLERDLTKGQAARLPLNGGGISERIDWIKTFRRFASQTEPDSYGNFNNGKPLTAEDVYKRLFIPVSPQ